MKERILAVLLALALLLCGCEPQQEEISQPESSESSSVESRPEQSVPEVSEEITFLRENFPRIDGSTSLIPLEAGVRAARPKRTWRIPPHGAASKGCLAATRI